MVKICRLTQDLTRRVFAVVYTFVIFIHSLSSVHLFRETAQTRPLTANFFFFNFIILYSAVLGHDSLSTHSLS